ncbi:MAG: ATP-binding cassette domain-containing protein [Gammaproteobacteria bacterium]|nr:ATP-binding cassette domain-containing protein [Gammaproteobacteria bacterium]
MEIEPGRIIVQADRVTKRVAGPRGELTILEDVSLSIARGQSLAIVGVSGSGKSTLLGLLAGLDVPTRGRVTLLGVDLTRVDHDERAGLRAGRVGFVFQNFQLLASLTALENVLLPLELLDIGDEAAARTVLQRVGLKDRLDHYPSQLSGGEQQRVALARAFAGAPEVLFADEPTGNLDNKTGRQIIDLLFQLNQENGTTLVMVTHDRELGIRCQRHLQLDAGRLTAGYEP